MPTFPEIPGYKFVKKLGQGGMADVYLAIQQNLNRMVAIKILIPLVFRNTNFLKRFKREAHTLSKLVHPNIITVFDVGKTGESYFIVMEYLQESLTERMKKIRKPKPEEALLIIKQIAGALFYAHRMGFIHRDIKPDNIMFRRDGVPVLLDFGIVRSIDSSTKLTKTGMSIGTPSYISPEQAKGEKIDGRSDIYSLGVVLFEMLTGKTPYFAENTLGVILKHIEDPIPRLPSHLKKYQVLVDCLMEKNPRKRIHSENELNALLRPLLETEIPDRGKKKKMWQKKNNFEISTKTKEVSGPFSRISPSASSPAGLHKPVIPRKSGKLNDISEKGIELQKASGRLPKKFPVFKTTILITVLLGIGLLILRYLYFRSDSLRLDARSVSSMIEKNDFFDRIQNRYGRFDNQFEKKSIGNQAVILDHATGLMWCPYGSSGELKHEMVEAWLSSFNREKFAGFQDWRLPTLKEAATLLIDPGDGRSLYIHPLFSSIQKSIWTANTLASSNAWVVRFDQGYIQSSPFDGGNFIRPVRSIE